MTERVANFKTKEIAFKQAFFFKFTIKNFFFMKQVLCLPFYYYKRKILMHMRDTVWANFPDGNKFLIDIEGIMHASRIYLHPVIRI